MWSYLFARLDRATVGWFGLVVAVLFAGGVVVVVAALVVLLLAPPVDEETAMRIIREWLPAGP